VFCVSIVRSRHNNIYCSREQFIPPVARAQGIGETKLECQALGSGVENLDNPQYAESVDNHATKVQGRW